jgi:TraX protein
MKAVIPSPFRSLVKSAAWLRPTLTSGQQETLKWLAILTMTFHTTDMILFANAVPLLFWLSRIAFPLFAFLIAYNLVVREVKPTRYLYPLLIFALFTQPVTMRLWGSYQGNIFFTLCFGVLYVGLYDLLSKRLHPLLSHTVLILLFLMPGFQMEYGPVGVFLIPVLVYYLRNPMPLTFFGLIFYLVAVNNFYLYAAWGLLALPLVFWVSRYPLTLPRTNSWFFYLYYPCHLLVLKVLQSGLY